MNIISHSELKAILPKSFETRVEAYSDFLRDRFKSLDLQDAHIVFAGLIKGEELLVNDRSIIDVDNMFRPEFLDERAKTLLSYYSIDSRFFNYIEYFMTNWNKLWYILSDKTYELFFVNDEEIERANKHPDIKDIWDQVQNVINMKWFYFDLIVSIRDEEMQKYCIHHLCKMDNMIDLFDLVEKHLFLENNLTQSALDNLMVHRLGN